MQIETPPIMTLSTVKTRKSHFPPPVRYLHHGLLPTCCCCLLVIVVVLGARFTLRIHCTKDTSGGDVVRGFIVIVTARAHMPVSAAIWSSRELVYHTMADEMVIETRSRCPR